jgi:hypothetical protein
VLAHQRQQLDKHAAVIREHFVETGFENPEFFEEDNQLAKVLK